MKKRLLSILLVLSFVLSAVPFGILADDTDTITKWDGLLYEGKFSVTADVSAEPDVYFAGSGIGDDGDLSSASYYHAYISGSTLKVDKCEPGKTENVGSAPVTATGNVTLSIAYSLNGEIFCWIDDVRVLEISDCTPYGAEIAYDDATSGVALDGGLTLVNTGSKTATYNAKSYTFTTAGSKVVSYFSNRTIKDGYIVLSKGTATAVGGPMFGMMTNGETGHDMKGGRSFYLVDHKSGKYRFIVSDEAADAANGIADITSWTTYKNGRFTGYNFTTNNDRCGWMFGGGGDASANVAFPSTALTINFNIGSTEANVSAGNISFTDKDPFGGQYYGVYSEAAANTTYTFYAVNNAVEAMDIDIVSATGVKVGETGEVTVKTIPEGSVINSGDSIKIAGDGISQKGEAVDNGDGTYTITYEAIAAGETAITASVNNHIYGELSDTEAVSIAQPDTGKTRWDGILYEGKFSVKVDASTSTGVYFAANGITVAGDLSTASYYHAYIENSVLKVDKYENGAPAGNVGEKAVDATGTVMLSVAYSLNGAVSIWIEYDRVLDLSGCTPYGTQIAYDNEATDFTIVGELKLVNTGGANATYDAKSYTFTIAGSKVNAYFSNRMIKDGYIVLNKNTNTTGAGGPIFGVYYNGTALGNSNKQSGRSFYLLDSKGGSYRFIVSDHDATSRNSITADNTDAYRANRFPDYNVGDNGDRTSWMYGTGNGTSVSYGNDTSVKVDFKIGDTTTTVSTGKISLTDKEPFGGQYYGLYSEAAANTTYTFYAVNNEVEAMDIDFTGIAFNETTGVYTATLTTFPAGSVINSGDYIKVTGANLEQIGEMTDLGNGVYTVQFKTTATGTATAEFSVDNHIYGTLSASTEQKFEHVHTPGAESCEKAQTCTVCGEEVASAKGHDYPEKWTDAGDGANHKKVCANDASHVLTAPHAYGDNWVDGKKICTDCGYVLDCDHDYDAVVTKPTCEAGGFTTHTCKICGISYTDGNTDATGHAYPDTWTDAGENHKKVCANDASHVITEAHSYDDAYDTDCNGCGLIRDVNTHTDAIRVNGDSYTDATIVNGNTVTIKAEGVIKWAQGTGTNIFGNWAGFRIYVPEGVDASKAIYTRPNGTSTSLAEVLDTGKNYASVYYLMTEINTATYYLDWNGDGVNELAVVIDVTGAIKHPETCQGGEATCTEAAVCEYCGKPYGKALGHTYDDDFDTDCNRCDEGRESVKTAVAIVGSVKYDSLQEAVNNANGGTVQLLANVDLNRVRLTISADCTLDLNGYTLTSKDKGDNVNAMAIYVADGVNFTLEDNVGGGMVVSQCYGVYVKKGATFTMNGGTIRVTGNGTFDLGIVTWNADFIMNGGKIEARIGVYACEYYADAKNSNIVINNGTIIADGRVGAEGDPSVAFVAENTNGVATITVLGGTFNTDVTDFCAKGHHTILDGEYYVYGAHKYVAGTVVEATCMEGGYTVYTCECGDTYNGDITGINASNHVISTEDTNIEWSKDDTHHWKECECKARLDEEEHTGLDCKKCGNKTIGVYKVGDDLYFRDEYGNVLTDKFYVTEGTANGLVTEGWYYADKTGKFIDDDFYTDSNGVKRYIRGGKAVYTRVTEIKGNTYFIDWDGVVLIDKIYVSASAASASGIADMTEGWYYADKTGAFIKEGFYQDGSVKRYIVNGKAAYTRMTYIDLDGEGGEDGAFYFIDWDGVVLTKKYYASADATEKLGLKEGWYYPDETGKFMKEGFYDDNGVKRYIVNGQAVYKRVTKIGDDYYMIEWNGVVVINTDKFYITESSAKANPGDGFPKGAGWYKTDKDGKIILD